MPNTTHLVYIALEYCLADLFSGNGVASRSQIRGLTSIRPSLHIHIIAGRPPHPSPLHPSDTPPNTHLHTLPLASWKTTDRRADHISFARNAGALLNSLLPTITPKAIIVVDWTGAAVLASLGSVRPPVVYVNFRVYARMEDVSADDRAFYEQREAAAVQATLETGGAIMALSGADCNALEALSGMKGRSKVILPMLRAEFQTICPPPVGGERRKYFSCLVRFSREKAPDRFVDVCCRINEIEEGFWDRVGILPLMAGAESQPEYASCVKAHFKAVKCGIMVDEFLNPAQLASVMGESVLSLHTSLYEAYGMTIVEAAAFGCPTIFHHSGIGAEQLLSPAKGAAIATDLEDVDVVARLCMALMGTEEGKEELRRIGDVASAAARSWTEEDHAASLLDLVEQCVSPYPVHS